ncbi:hypothetical protein H6758_03335 [Candidatus Nomurabacteria bacterium]|nr:hypothetical protein [Candidatus Nomurabacteria bacterium]
MATNRFTRYKDPTGEFSNTQLQVGSWYLRHKLFLEKIFLVALILVSGGLGIYGIGGLGYYFVVGYFQDRDILQSQVQEIQNSSYMHVKTRVANMEFRGLDVFTHTPRHYDFLVPAANPNPRHLSHVTYRFVYSGGQTPARTVTILPQSQSYLHYFDQQSDQYPENARLEVLNVAWQRLDPRAFPDPKAYMDLRSKFEIEDFVFNEPSDKTGLLTNQVTFGVRNLTAFDFYELDFLVILFNAGQVVGVQPLYLQDLPTRRAEQVDLRFGNGIRFVESAELLVVSNLFDTSIYAGN